MRYSRIGGVSVAFGFVVLSLWPLVNLREASAAEGEKGEVRVEDLRAGGNADQRYFLMRPESAKTPRRGFALVLVLPGGDGGEGFRGFVENIRRQVFSDDVLVAQLVSKKWTDTQRIIWPTERTRAAQMKFTSEQFADAVIRDVRRRHRIDPRRISTLSWSSGGPAAYAISLTNPDVTASFIAMSVFRTEWLPPLRSAKGHAYFLLQSPDDEVTKFAQAEAAKQALGEHRARVELESYAGGHGWHGDPFGNLRKGFAWMEKNRSAPRKK